MKYLFATLQGILYFCYNYFYGLEPHKRHSWRIDFQIIHLLKELMSCTTRINAMNKDDVENPAVFGSFQFFRFCWSLCGTFGGDGKHSVGEACVFLLACVVWQNTSQVIPRCYSKSNTNNNKWQTQSCTILTTECLCSHPISSVTYGNGNICSLFGPKQPFRIE